MANEQNLKPVRSKSEARERGKKGGKASGAARRARKTFKEDLLAMLSDGDTQAKILQALAQQAKRGNIKAFEVIRDTIGEKPVENEPDTAAELSKVTDVLVSMRKVAENAED